jgi:hypothetical protein
MSLFHTYRATEGLDQFPPHQRFGVWRAAHKKLKADDPGYRAGCRRYFWEILLVTVAYAVIVNIICWPREDGTFAGLGMIGQSIMTLLLTAVYLPYLLIVTVRQQRWLNAKVAEEIGRRAEHKTPDAI